MTDKEERKRYYTGYLFVAHEEAKDEEAIVEDCVYLFIFFFCVYASALDPKVIHRFFFN